MPEYAWLAALLEDRPNPSPGDTETEVSVFDVDSDGRVPDPKFGPLPHLNYASAWLQSPRKPDNHVRIIYVRIENEDLFNTTIIDILAMEYNLEPKFFFDHFLPSLWSDRRLAFNGRPLSWVPPVPSRHQYLRFKNCEGRNISAAFICTDMTGANKTGNLHDLISGVSLTPFVVIILGPIKAKTQPSEDYKLQLCNFGKRAAGTPPPTVYNGSEYFYPVLHLLNKEFSDFLHNLKLQELNEENIATHHRRVVATEERLRYGLHNLTVLSDCRNPETIDIERHVIHLIGLSKQLKEDSDDWLEQATRLQNKEAAEKNLKTAIEARDEARTATELARNVWRLTLLAFIFIPLNFMTSAFAMHLRLLGFSENDGGLPTWSFFVVAVPVELLVLFLFRAISGYLVKVWGGLRHVVRDVWRSIGIIRGARTTSGDIMHELHGRVDQA